MKVSKKNIIIAALSILLVFVAAGCAAVSNFISTLRGELVGNDYVIEEFDNFGNRVLSVTGDKITMSCETDSNGEPTSYIDITIDGYEWQHVGSTLVFAQNGIDMITDFQLPDDIQTSAGSSTGLMAVDKYINHYRNLFGKKLIVIVSSQNGTPIGLFQGDNCYMEVPANLPKTTRLNIDGKAVYIHRGNVDIMPAAMFNSGR